MRAHTHTTAPAIGFEHPRFSRFRFITGDPAADGTPPPADTPTPDVTPAATPPAPAAGTPTPEGTPPAAVASPWDNPEAAKAEIEKLRKENGKARTDAKTAAAAEATQAVLATIQAALGVAPEGDKPPTAEALAQQLADQTAAVNAAKRETAILRAASGVEGLNVNALLDSRAFAESVKDIAPDDAAGIAAAITKATEANPLLKAAAAPPRNSGGEHRNTGEGKRPISIENAISTHYGAK